MRLGEGAGCMQCMGRLPIGVGVGQAAAPGWVTHLQVRGGGGHRLCDGQFLGSGGLL